MIAATYTQNVGYRIEDVPIPEIGPDELLVRVMASSICGTDLRIIRSGHRKLSPGQKLVLGHEFAGVVAKAGSRVRQFHEGQRVGVAPNMGCGQCEECIRGLPNMCPDYTAFGITMDGAHTEYVRIPSIAIVQGSVIPLPDHVPFEQASLIEPLSCVVNANRASRIEPGNAVLIFGAGPVGVMHLMLSRLSGAAIVVVADVQTERLQSAAELGATAVVNSTEEDLRERLMQLTAGRGADVVITACSVAAVQEQALGLLAPFGRLCLFGGLPKDNSCVRFDTNLIHYRQLIVTGVTGGAPRDFRAAMRLLAAGRIPVERVISHRFAQADMAAAFDVAMKGDAMKVVLVSSLECGAGTVRSRVAPLGTGPLRTADDH
jgi:2-desacetyl-2-hydroxyethyl bacteriochlorophyllide A dehydrogenase